MSPPRIFLLTGPPAVGKMTVGRVLAQRLDYLLFHNHHSIEFALKFFRFGSPEFSAVNEGIRRLMFETAASSKDLKGFIFTLVWAFDLKEDWDYVADLKLRFQASGWQFHIVELCASMEVRAQRNDSPSRLLEKPSKQDVAVRNAGLYGMEQKHQMNSNHGQVTEANYLRIDNSEISPDQVVDQIVSFFGLGGEQVDGHWESESERRHGP